MGQPVTVVNKASNRKGILSFELNRSITGMGHRNYFFDEMQSAGSTQNSDEQADPVDPLSENRYDIADILAQKLHQKYGPVNIKSLHINSNIITLETATGAADHRVEPAEISKLLEELFVYYSPK